MKTFVILIASLLLTQSGQCEWTQEDEGHCRATGVFENTWYGFVVCIPPGLHGCPNSPVWMTDHGVIIPLAELESPRSVECYAAYNVFFYQSAEDAADDDVDSLVQYSAVAGSMKILRRGPSTLGSLRAVRVVARYKDTTTGIKMIQDSTVALRDIVKNNTTPSHHYAVTLTTPVRYYRKDRAMLEAVLSTWRVGPAEDEEQ